MKRFLSLAAILLLALFVAAPMPHIALPRPSSLLLDPSTVTGSQTVTCTVTMDRTWYADYNVSISTDTPEAFDTLPSSVMVEAGHISATFEVVTAEDAEGTPRITAMVNGWSTYADLEIQ